MLRVPDTPIMCLSLRISDDIDAVIWVKNAVNNIDTIFVLHRIIWDSSRALFISIQKCFVIGREFFFLLHYLHFSGQ